MHIRLWSGALIVLADDCTSDGDPPATDRTDSQTGGSGGGKSSSTGGSAGEAIGSGGSSVSGSGGTAGSSAAGSGGASSGGGGSAGKGGAAGGGGGNVQSDAGAYVATPSAGCGKGMRPAGGVVTVADQYILTFPANYDGKVPMPVVFGFHGANRTNVDFRGNDAATQGGDFEKNYVMAYVKSVGNDWTSQLAPNFARFDAVYDVLANTY